MFVQPHLSNIELLKSLSNKYVDTSAFYKNSTIQDETGNPSATNQLLTLLSDHETIVRLIRSHLSTIGDKYGDLGTADHLTGVMEAHEKTAWMLRAMTSEFN